MSSTYIPERALLIYAHPDDIDFSVAGTVAYWAKNGADVRYVVITDGNIGSHDPDMTSEKLAQIRRAEQQKAADIAGAGECVFLGYPDGRLQPTLELRQVLVREIRRFKPNAVVCGDPTSWFGRDTYINHPDHRAAAAAAVEACFPAPNSPLIFPEILAEGYGPHDINYVYISNPREKPNLYVDITDTLPTKIEALKAHKSQMKDWDPTERITAWAKEVGHQVGLECAERFYRITLNEIKEEETA